MKPSTNIVKLYSEIYVPKDEYIIQGLHNYKIDLKYSQNQNTLKFVYPREQRDATLCKLLSYILCSSSPFRL